MEVTTDISRTLGPQFFLEQDRLRGGPSEAMCAPDYSAQIGGNPIMDLDGHQQFAKMFYAGIPDAKHTIEDVIAEPGKVAVRFMINGRTPATSWAFLPPATRLRCVESRCSPSATARSRNCARCSISSE
jgi:hypothetical protein